MSHPTEHKNRTEPHDLSPDRMPWERQKGESAKAFTIFAMYRDMGPARRIVDLQAEGKKLGKKIPTLSQLYRWSSVWRWTERVDAWDAELDRIARTAQAEEIKRMNERHIKLGMKAQAKALEKLLATNTDEMTPTEAVRFMKEGVKVERLARGEATEKLEANVDGQVKTTHEHTIAKQLLENPDAAALAEQLFRFAAGGAVGHKGE